MAKQFVVYPYSASFIPAGLGCRKLRPSATLNITPVCMFFYDCLSRTELPRAWSRL
jgi:hypothetical protein